MTLSIRTFSIVADLCQAECRLFWVSEILMLSVVMMSDVAPNERFTRNLQPKESSILNFSFFFLIYSVYSYLLFRNFHFIQIFKFHFIGFWIKNIIIFGVFQLRYKWILKCLNKTKLSLKFMFHYHALNH